MTRVRLIEKENHPTSFHYDLPSFHSPKCLPFEEKGGGMDDLIDASDQIFITMPAKAAGSTLKVFARQCLNSPVNNNIVNKFDGGIEEFFVSNFDLPKVISSHLVRGGKPLINLIQQTTKDALLIHVYRDETERLTSALRFVLGKLCFQKNNTFRDGMYDNHRSSHSDDGKRICLVDEVAVVEILKKRYDEIAFSTFATLPCGVYDAIEQNAPKIVFMHYSSVNQLQKAIAKKHCPEMLDQPILAVNVASTRPQEFYVNLPYNNTSNKSVVSYDEWIQAKGGLMEWALNAKKKVSCQAKTKMVGAALASCHNEAVQISPFF